MLETLNHHGAPIVADFRLSTPKDRSATKIKIQPFSKIFRAFHSWMPRNSHDDVSNRLTDIQANKHVSKPIETRPRTGCTENCSFQ